MASDDDGIVADLEAELLGHGQPEDEESAAESGAASADEAASQSGVGDSIVEALVACEEVVAQPVAASSVAAPPPIQGESRRRRSANPNNVNFPLPDGNALMYYAGPGSFYALCRHSHALGSSCRMTRTSRALRSKPSSGRPVGFLMAWLQAQGEYATTAGHHDECMPSREDRVLARRYLHSLHGSEVLFALEREQRVALGEDSEPDDCP